MRLGDGKPDSGINDDVFRNGRIQKKKKKKKEKIIEKIIKF